MKIREFTGEFIGTFLMVFFGVGAVAVSTLFKAYTGPLQVGLVWGLAIALAIYATRNLSCAHFNTAVSIAMVVSGRMSAKLLPTYVAGQVLGAFVASLALFGVFSGSMAGIEAQQIASGVLPGTAGSVSSIFCEVYPNAATAGVSVTTPVAFAAEAIGTFLLLVLIFSITEKCNLGRPSVHGAPLFIGLTITCIISVVGPLTDAGLNPARDIGPRLAALFMGYGSIAFSWQALLVYALGPITGGVVAALVFTRVIEPVQRLAPSCGCGGESDDASILEETGDVLGVAAAPSALGVAEHTYSLTARAFASDSTGECVRRGVASDDVH